MTVQTCGRDEVECGLVVRGTWALVSIHDADRPPARLRNPASPRGVLRLAFDDTEPPTDRVLMAPGQAAEVVAFAREQLVAGTAYLVVHCEQGASRSPAVAAALVEGLGLEPAEDFDGWYNVNRHVRSLVLAACSR